MKLKQIYLLHHSHLDIGFTHSQVVLEQLQTDFLNQALDLLEATEDWDEPSKPRWTVEAHEQFRLWLERAAPDQVARMKNYARTGRVSVSAIRYNTTPLSSLESLHRQLVDIRTYRDEFGFPVKAAFQNDVNGLPWAMSDLLLDAGVELFVMAINLHTGANGPVRPGLFNWITPSGRRLLVLSGHDYASFDAFTRPWENSVEEMRAGLEAQWDLLQDLGYPYDFLYLTSTNLPVSYDNGGPSLMTAEKVREWNQQPGYPTIHYVSPEELKQKLEAVPSEVIPSFTGDWNDCWNYGAGSAAREVELNAYTKRKLFASSLLGLQQPFHPRLHDLQDRAWDRVQAFEEHTWGYWAHGMDADHPQCVTTELYKRNTAHDGHEMARYVLGSRLADYSENPSMFTSEGLLAVNPSPVKKGVSLHLPRGWRDEILGHLSGFQYHHAEPLTPIRPGRFWPVDADDVVQLDLEPFSALRIPWGACEAPPVDEEISDGSMEEIVHIHALDGHEAEVRRRGQCYIASATHVLEYDPTNGRITRLFDKALGWEVLPEKAEYNLFEPIHEKPDARFDGSRKSYYDRVVETELRFESCWNPDWKFQRKGIQEVLDVRVERGPRSVSLIREFRMEGISRLIQRFELSADRPWIEVNIIIHKEAVRSPESVYFVSQVNLEAGWDAVYDGSGIPITLDAENLPGSNRNWITQEAFTRLEGGGHQFSVFSPGMPLVQIGGFHWGRPKDQIERQEHPLLLNWACNNYWETNFPVTQEGVIRYTCGIYTSRDQSPSELYRMADGFANRPLFLPLAECSDIEGLSLVDLDNPRVRLASINDAVHHQGFICRLVNPGADRERCQLTFGSAAEGAAIVSPEERVLETCAIEAGQVSVELSPRATLSLLVTRA